MVMPFLAMSQTTNGSIKGKVVNEIGEPLIGANIYLEVGSNARGAATDLDGNFHIRQIPVGIYNIRFSFTGYKTMTKSKVQVSADNITLMGSVQLGTNDTLITVEITEWREPLINMDNPSKITKTFKEIQHSPNIRNAAALIQSFSPEIKMSETGELYFRGGRSNASVYFVDGVKVESPAQVPGVSIGSMSVYTGGVPAKYGDTTGGVVIMETKSYFDLYNIWRADND